MITIKKNTYLLETDNTAYCFQVLENGILEHIYYGAKLPRGEDYLALRPRYLNAPGNTALLEDGTCLESLAQEVGTRGFGDVREPLVTMENQEGSGANLFTYFHYSTENVEEPQGLPASRNADNQLKITLKDEDHGLCLELIYKVFEKEDTIVRRSRLINDSDAAAIVTRLFSSQLDLPARDYELHTFHGTWVREMKKVQEEIVTKCVWDSTVGTSSNRCNPFAMIAEKGSSERFGNVWAMNLIYSGNHTGIAQKDSLGCVRALQGMDQVRWHLEPHSFLDAPEAVLSFSSFGFGGISENMHAFVSRHIVPKQWQGKERPILCNSWEAMYFKVDHHRLVQLGKEAKDLGIELLVMDDGWFTGRKDDHRALGDWTADKRKLPKGIAGIAKDIKELGLGFGIWIEPEMTNRESQLYKTHPDWILGKEKQAIGRNQYVLDLANPAVVEYLFDSLSALLQEGNVSYVKWDMNRIQTDTFSSFLPKEQQGEAQHRYMLGLYDLLTRLSKVYPDVLFEGCASGGNRSDLGILCYMPQLWASDNTDALCRAGIQQGYSYGYPQSVLGCHVSACPNHQTLRHTPLHSRLQVASFGLLGFELDLGSLEKAQREEIKDSIAFYKEHRKTFQFGTFHRTALNDNETFWSVVSEDQKTALALHFVKENMPNAGMHPIRVYGLNPIATYQIRQRVIPLHLKDFGTLVNMISPIPIKDGSFLQAIADKTIKFKSDEIALTLSGNALEEAGFYPVQVFSGTGLEEGTGAMKDYDSRLYILEESEN